MTTLTRDMVVEEITRQLAVVENLVGVCCLAAGADQMFASAVLGLGGRLRVVIPCSGYETTFGATEQLIAYETLLARAEQMQQLAYEAPSEEAFMAAGQVVVDQSESLVAVWDGRRAAGLGGTADVVTYAQQRGKSIIRVWPVGASR